MDYEALKETIKEVLDQTRQKHIVNAYVTFHVTYYSVKENGECVQSASSSIFEDMKWGMIYVYYCPGKNYRGYFEGELDRYFVSNEGLISTYLVFDDLKLAINGVGSRIESNDGTILYNAQNTEPEKIMSEVDKVLPIIHGCRTREEANMLIEIERENAMEEKDSRRDMVEILLKEISQLKEKMSSYEKKIEEMRLILLRDED